MIGDGSRIRVEDAPGLACGFSVTLVSGTFNAVRVVEDRNWGRGPQSRS